MSVEATLSSIGVDMESKRFKQLMGKSHDQLKCALRGVLIPSSGLTTKHQMVAAIIAGADHLPAIKAMSGLPKPAPQRQRRARTLRPSALPLPQHQTVEAALQVPPVFPAVPPSPPKSPIPVLSQPVLNIPAAQQELPIQPEGGWEFDFVTLGPIYPPSHAETTPSATPNPPSPALLSIPQAEPTPSVQFGDDLWFPTEFMQDEQLNPYGSMDQQQQLDWALFPSADPLGFGSFDSVEWDPTWGTGVLPGGDACL